MHRQLIISAGPEKARTFSLEDGQALLIGRVQQSDTKITDPHMSRVRSHVHVDGGTMELVDNGSSSGTLTLGRLGGTVRLEVIPFANECWSST